ncbi:hypothetical protein C8F04DRAFT_1066821 [Mycena alexandri]|uniref:Uncharacterized protein n=1 Tax=Mycena alexandri TaxID=1745969 RepID=A0AAD6TKL6_9AGAR|nr:hypothetical protein C8F04DRAFT_1066821 [Mycena alexandri]
MGAWTGGEKMVRVHKTGTHRLLCLSCTAVVSLQGIHRVFSSGLSLQRYFYLCWSDFPAAISLQGILSAFLLRDFAPRIFLSISLQ